MDFRPSRMETLPTGVKNIMIINALFFLTTIVFGRFGRNPIDLSPYLAMHHWSSPDFKFWQPLTHLFMHGDVGIPNADYEAGFLHIFSNMFALWMFGSILENYFGTKRFVYFYLLCGIGASIFYLLVVQFFFPAQIPSLSMVGASGAVFGILFAFGYTFPNTEMMFLFLPFPIKAKYFVAMYALFELYSGIRNNSGDNVAHFAHLGGLVVAFIILKIWNKTNRKTLY